MRVFAGPWVGEFGWELFHWQGMLRAYQDALPEAQFIVAGRPGHAVLYRDFAADYVEVPVPADRANVMWRCPGVDPSAIEFGQSARESGDVHLPPSPGALHLDPANFLLKTVRQRFVRYQGEGPRFDLLLHARSRALGANRSWPAEKWTALARALLDGGHTVASIGSPTGAFCVPGTEDVRGVPLEALVGTLSGARAIIGPSSGPMHLAALCGTPHLAWSSVTNRDRYLKHWNPHRTPCEFLSLWNRTWSLTRTVYPGLVVEKLPWNPPVARVLAGLDRLLAAGGPAGGGHG